MKYRGYEVGNDEETEGKKDGVDAIMEDISTEVIKRWGDRGSFSSNCKRPNNKRSFRVGYIECGFFNVEGEGGSWEEALANADKKARK